jgi:hypothetical protein
MKEIPTYANYYGMIVCLAASNTCPYTSTCANHNSAGDFRTEDGFTPNLSRETNSNGFRECVTADVMKAWGGGCLPVAACDLGSGALCEDGSTCSLPLPFDEVEPVERTFRDALNAARDALDEAWGKMPTGEAGRINDGLDGWSVQRLLVNSRQSLMTLLNLLGMQT